MKMSFLLDEISPLERAIHSLASDKNCNAISTRRKCASLILQNFQFNDNSNEAQKSMEKFDEIDDGGNDDSKRHRTKMQFHFLCDTLAKERRSLETKQPQKTNAISKCR